ncbi:hypothetical protein T484DRAFT_1796230 [Baffinella frigidus]|nr:hypothetical protein T484DRAFT_1796230 [Cryptophyta sp. CCMP2293]
MGGPERMSRVDMAKGVCSHRGYPEGRIKHSSRAALDLGFTSPLDISMDSSLLDSQPWAIAALPQGRTTWAAALHKVLV